MLERWGLSCNGCTTCGPEYVHHDTQATAGGGGGRGAGGPRAAAHSRATGLYSAAANVLPDSAPPKTNARVVCVGGYSGSNPNPQVVRN